MIRIGVLGCGDVANFGHIPAILSTDGVELVALYDPNPVRLSSTSARFDGLPTFDSTEEFYGQGLDAVVIASPAPTHLAGVLEAATRDVHVLCEKPISEDESEAETMIGAMNISGKIFMVGFCYRFSPVARQIKQWIEEGTVGKIRALRLIYIWNLHGRYQQQPDHSWVENPRWAGRMVEGGPMVDCGVHMIDLSRWWLESEIVRAAASGAWVADYEAPDHMWLNMDHRCGAHTNVEMSFTYCHTAREPINHFSYHLIGDGGILRYDRDGYVLEARTGQETIRVPGASEKNFEGMYAAFRDAIRSGDTTGLPLAQDGLIATKIAREATNLVMGDRARPTA